MMTAASGLRPFSGRLWRICTDGADPLAPVSSPEGRFHHGGQPALYTSLSPEGAAVALASYVTRHDPPRLIWPLDLNAAAMADLRDPDTCAAFGIDLSDPVARWTDDRAAGRPARSWRASDRLRALGATGGLYASRKAPHLGHAVLFEATGLRLAGAPTVWTPTTR